MVVNIVIKLAPNVRLLFIVKLPFEFFYSHKIGEANHVAITLLQRVLCLYVNNKYILHSSEVINISCNFEMTT